MFKRFSGPLCGLAFLLCAVASAPSPASAHHGWGWTTGKNIELTGKIVGVKLGYPHGEVTLDVDGTKWTLQVGQPWRNKRAGLEDADFAEGVELTVSGEPSRDSTNKLLKVERLWIKGAKYELYPERD